MVSQRVLCWEAKTWTLVIGWLQTILHAFSSGSLTLILLVHAFMNEAHGGTDKDEDDPDHHIIDPSVPIEHYFSMILVVAVLLSVVCLVAGIMLILSVKQANAKNLKLWIIVQLVLLIFPVILLILAIIDYIFEVLIILSTVIVINVFCIWVINVHRKELLSVGECRVRYVSRI